MVIELDDAIVVAVAGVATDCDLTLDEAIAHLLSSALMSTPQG